MGGYATSSMLGDAMSLCAFKSLCKVKSFILASKMKSTRVQNVVSCITDIIHHMSRTKHSNVLNDW